MIIYSFQSDEKLVKRQNEDRLLGQQHLYIALAKEVGWVSPSVPLTSARIAQYQFVLRDYIRQAKSPCFYEESFKSNPYKTASYLLAQRDNLKEAGWTFAEDESTNQGNKLRILCRLEPIWQKVWNQESADMSLWGRADWLDHLYAMLDMLDWSKHRFYIAEPSHLWPAWWTRFAARLTDLGAVIQTIPSISIDHSIPNNLHKLKAWFTDPNTDPVIFNAADNSVTIQAFADEEDMLNDFMSHDIPANSLIIMEDTKISNDLAITQHGKPGLGISVAGNGRLKQQLLRLAHEVLWWPLDVNKVVSLLNIPESPIPFAARRRLIRALVQNPGFNAAQWHMALKEIQEDEQAEQSMTWIQAWFMCDRYERNEGIQVYELIAFYNQLGTWIRTKDMQEEHWRNVMTQIKELIQYLQVLDSDSLLTYSEWSQVVHGIADANIDNFIIREMGALEYVRDPASIVGTCQELHWLYAYKQEAAKKIPFFSTTEYEAIQVETGVNLDPINFQEDLQKYKLHQVILSAHDRLVLYYPKQVLGETAHPNNLTLLLAELFHCPMTATTQQVTANTASQGQFLSDPILMNLPAFDLATQEVSSTRMNDLVYYPHKFALYTQYRLAAKNHHVEVQDFRLMGNLAHQLTERWLKVQQQSPEVLLSDWFGNAFDQLLADEGWPLLMYGRERDRLQFQSDLFRALVELTHHIRSNGWSIHSVEQKRSSTWQMLNLVGIPDLVLQRGDEYAVVDLKWTGKSKRTAEIKNLEDHQLTMYAYLLNTNNRVHTAYFIGKSAAMLARDTAAFTDAQVAGNTTDDKELLLNALAKAIQVRAEQLQEGTVECRTIEHQSYFEDFDLSIMMEDGILPKSAGDLYDDFRFFIGTES